MHATVTAPRVPSVVPARNRVGDVLDAVLSIGGDLDLQAVLHRIIQVAAMVVDAEYAALGVISQDGQGLSEFLVVGIDDEKAQQIGDLPTGRGVLGTLIRDPRPLRLDDLAEDPDSVGFPPGHPPMRTFLGAPIRVHDALFGNLYLTEKRGGACFDDDDETVVLALATAAGVAIQNARLYADSRRREQWLAATSDVATALLSGHDPTHGLRLVVANARAVTGGALAFVALPLDEERLVVEVADGVEVAAARGAVIPRHGSALAEVIATGLPRRVPAVGLPSVPPGAETVAAPLPGQDGQPLGVLVVAGVDPADAAGIARALADFAAQAAVALELAARRREAERFALFDDRDRIARDLHDLVIQRLFATGMHLESAGRMVGDRPQEAGARITQAVDDLDSTIREIRSAIYGLQASQDRPPSLRARLLHVVDDGADQLGYAPGLRLQGTVEADVPAHVAEDLLAVLRESLSNAARHARARTVDVRVSVEDGVLLLEVSDDGVGIADTSRRSGLANLAARADALGGSFSLTTQLGNGTTVSWRVPLSAGSSV